MPSDTICPNKREYIHFAELFQNNLNVNKVGNSSCGVNVSRKGILLNCTHLQHLKSLIN